MSGHVLGARGRTGEVWVHGKVVSSGQAWGGLGVWQVWGGVGSLGSSGEVSGGLGISGKLWGGLQSSPEFWVGLAGCAPPSWRVSRNNKNENIGFKTKLVLSCNKQLFFVNSDAKTFENLHLFIFLTKTIKK